MAEGQSIIGLLGYGRFGRALAELLTAHGYGVTAFDPVATVPEQIRAASVSELAAEAGVIFVAVPIGATRSALAELRPHLGAGQVVADVGSVKVNVREAMEQVLGDDLPWVATHPLFGPASLRLGGAPLEVVICPSPAHPAAADQVAAIYRRLGCDVLIEDAVDHDRRMATTHALTFFIAKGLLDAGVDGSERFTPASFRAIARVLDTVRSDAGHLFGVLQLHNPYAAEARQSFLASLAAIDATLDAAQVDGASPGPQGLTIPSLAPAEDPTLRSTRELIDLIDRELIELVARRLQLARRAGSAKQEQGRAIRDPARERALLADRRALAEQLGVSGEQVEALFKLLMQLSREVQGGS